MIGLLFATWIQAALGAPEAFERTNIVMGTPLSIRVEGVARKDAVQISEKILASMRQTERRLSTWVEDSELSQMNRAEPGKTTRLSAALGRDLENVFSCEEWTEGAFSPKLGPVVQAWDLRKRGRWVDWEAERAKDPSTLLSWNRSSSELTFKEGAVYWKKNHPQANLEEGAFGKGVALDDAAVEHRESAAKIRLNLGGQVKHFGAWKKTGTFSVQVADFRDRLQGIVEVATDRSDASTSSQTEKSFQVGDPGRVKTFGHILDPRTGSPSPRSGSMTVFARQGWLADCLSTGFFVLEPAQQIRIWKQARLRKQAWAKDVEWIWIGPGKKDEVQGRASCGLKGRVRFLKKPFAIDWEGC